MWWGPVGPVSISFFSPSNSIYKPPLCFDRVGGLYLGFAFSFSNNGCVIFCVIWWGPVSISYSLCDVVGACVYKFFSPSNSVYKPPLCFWCGAILRCFQIQISLFFKGACVYNPCTVSNLDMLRFNKFFQIQTRFILYVEWGPMCIFLVIVVTPLTSHFGLCLFFFSNNGCVILCVI